MYLVVEALADGGVRMGLPRDLAQRLAAQTMMVGLPPPSPSPTFCWRAGVWLIDVADGDGECSVMWHVLVILC